MASVGAGSDGLWMRAFGPAHLPELRVHQSLPPGGLVRLEGPSGVGKSSLLRAAARLDRFEGALGLDGRASEELPAPSWRTRVVWVGAETTGAGSTVAAWLRRPARFAAARARFDIETVRTEAEALGLGQLDFERRIDRASTGEQQRLRLARGLGLRPRVLLLDEPIAHLDPAAARRVWDRVEAFVARGGAVLYAAHQGGPGTALRLERS